MTKHCESVALATRLYSRLQGEDLKFACGLPAFWTFTDLKVAVKVCNRSEREAVCVGGWLRPGGSEEQPNLWPATDCRGE